MNLLNRAPTTIANPAVNKARAAALDRRVRSVPVRVPPPGDGDVPGACGFCGRREVVIDPDRTFDRVTFDGPTVDDDSRRPRPLTAKESENAADWAKRRPTPLPTETRATVRAADASEAWLRDQVWSHRVVTRFGGLGVPGGGTVGLWLCEACDDGLDRVHAVGPAPLTAIIADARPDLGLWPHETLRPHWRLTFAGRVLTARRRGWPEPTPTRVRWEWLTGVTRDD